MRKIVFSNYTDQRLYETDQISNARNPSYRKDKERWKNLLLELNGNSSQSVKDAIEKEFYIPEPSYVAVESPLARQLRLGKQYCKNFLHVA